MKKGSLSILTKSETPTPSDVKFVAIGYTPKGTFISGPFTRLYYFSLIDTAISRFVMEFGQDTVESMFKIEVNSLPANPAVVSVNPPLALDGLKTRHPNHLKEKVDEQSI